METSRLKLARYLAEHRHSKFKLGVLDCCLFATRWIDVLQNKNTTAAFCGKYVTDEDLETAWEQANVIYYLRKNGYQPVDDIKDTDIVLVEEMDHSSAWLALNNRIYTMTPRGLLRISPGLLKQKYTVWRYSI